MRPFLLESSSQFRTAGPNALASAAWATDFNEVKALGASEQRDPHARPDAQRALLAEQRGAGPALERRRAQSGRRPEPRLDLADSARLLAMMNLGGADAAINCWNDKYYCDFWRPWHAIHEADRDGNPATEPDPTWTALLTAPYPEHPSGHLCLDGAHLRVLQMFFGTTRVPFDVTSSRVPGGRDARLRQVLGSRSTEIIEARIWAGLHYRTADVQAQDARRERRPLHGRNYFQPVGNH